MPEESPTLGTARAVNGINVLVLAGIAVLLAFAHATNGSRAEVLATLLTIFPTIQASRLRQPDSTRLAGLLTMRHFKVGLLTAVPGLMLAGVLAFAPEGGWLLAAALVAVALQVGCHLWIRQLGDTPARPGAAPAPAPGRAGDRPHRRPRRLRRAALGLVPVADRARCCCSAAPPTRTWWWTGTSPASLTDLLTGAQGEVSGRCRRRGPASAGCCGTSGRASRPRPTRPASRSTCSACCAAPRSAGRRRSWSSGTRRSRTGWRRPPGCATRAAGRPGDPADACSSPAGWRRWSRRTGCST